MRRRRDKQPAESPPPTPPTHAENAQLTTGDGDGWQVRISEREGDVLMLALQNGPAALDAAPAGSLILECTSDHGLVRFAGDAVLEDGDLVRFRVQDPPEVQQRREFVRVRTPRQVVMAISGRRTIGSAYSVDLSGGGMLLSGVQDLRLDDRIRFRLHLDPNSPPIKGRGRVVRCLEDSQRAVVFEEISRQDRERLIHFIFARQREARARDRGLER
jgi:hypothetical protein